MKNHNCISMKEQTRGSDRREKDKWHLQLNRQSWENTSQNYEPCFSTEGLILQETDPEYVKNQIIKEKLSTEVPYYKSKSSNQKLQMREYDLI